MEQPAPAPDPAVESSTRFLTELETLWSLLRLYGSAHPAFRRGADAAIAALSRPLRVSVSPKGFTVGKIMLEHATLAPFAQRLRSMGLVGLVMEPGLTAPQVTALVEALHEADRTHAAGPAVAEKIAAATAKRVEAIPLRLAGLKLMEGTAQDHDAPPEQGTTVWRDMFAAALSSGRGGPAEAAEAAQSFELALKSMASPAQWDTMVEVWIRQLSAVESNVNARPAPADGIGPAAADHPDGNAPGNAVGEPGAARPSPGPLDGAAAFLGALSPHLCKRLLADTLSRSVPQSALVALADRLPKGLVLGALAAVDRTNGQPSAAALALLRKIASNLPGAASSGDVSAGAPRTTAEMVEIAASLEKVLGSTLEAGFVPDDYFRHRQELSGQALSPAGGASVAYPGELETTHHAAQLAFQILATPDTPAADAASALAYVRNRIGDWIKSGAFALAAEGLSQARALASHWDRAVAKPAAELVAHAVTVDDLVEGAGRSADRAAAATRIAELLRKLDGAALSRALATLKPSPAGGHEAVLDAVRMVLPGMSDDGMRGLCRSFRDATPPPALLAALTNLPGPDAVKAVAAIVPHANPAARRSIVHVIFRQDIRWPLPLTEQLLKDDEAEIRRLAVMKLVSDADLPTAARVFRAAADRKGPYEPDVALGLAELLRHHRNHPDVRAAFRQWMWSGRRWAVLFSLSLADRRRAA